MSVTIPLKEVIAECMKEPGFAEAREQARCELDAERAMYGTTGRSKLTLHKQSHKRNKRLYGKTRASRRIINIRAKQPRSECRLWPS